MVRLHAAVVAWRFESMQTWVTGAGGFMGGHLVDMLVSRGDPVLATNFRPTTNIEELNPGARVEVCDLRDRERTRSLVKKFRPNRVFHLAAQSYPSASWADPWYTVEANVIGTVNVFEGLKQFAPDCRILNACSSAQYGFVRQEEVPVTEEHPLKPLHPYGVSKVAQEMLAYQYYKNFNLQPVNVRIFNTTGPRKVGDVCSDLTRRLVEIEKGRSADNYLRVGTLTTKRAIMDVRDCIRAFDVAIEKGTIGETYNLSGDRVYEIRQIVEILRRLSAADFEVRQDPTLMRPSDEPIIWGSTSKLRAETGWAPRIRLRKTLSDMLAHWRQIL